MECPICFQDASGNDAISVHCVCKPIIYHRKCARKLVDENMFLWKCPFCRYTHPLPKVYLAGKAGSHERPQRIHCDGDLQDMYGKTHPVITSTGFMFVGPDMVTVGCDHGCYHDPNVLHCVGHGNDGCPESTGVSRSVILSASFDQIDKADYVYAIVSSPDAYGTLVEIGYAVAKNIPVYIDYPCRDGLRRDLWFSEQAARHVWQTMSEHHIKRYRAIKHLLPFDAECQSQYVKPYLISSDNCHSDTDDSIVTSHIGILGV